MTTSLDQSLAGASPDQWAADFLKAAGFPHTAANVQAVVSWEYAESGAGGGMYNPLNTTQTGYLGETNFNSVGVKNYATYWDGINANAHVIHNGYYPAVVTLFTAGTDARAICDAITRSPWGTGYIALRGTVAPVPTGPPPPTFSDPPIMLCHPLRGAWVARSDGVVFFVNADQTIIRGGMTTPADVAAFTGRTVDHLTPRAYGPGGSLHGYTIHATSGETYVPANQR